MAFLTSLSPRSPVQAPRVHSESEATWCRADRNGEAVVQVDTYGSSERKDVGTTNQSIQLDEAMAGELVEVLRKVFPNIR